MPGLCSITSAMQRASTLSFMVTPHWCEMFCSKVMSFSGLTSSWPAVTLMVSILVAGGPCGRRGGSFGGDGGGFGRRFRHRVIDADFVADHLDTVAGLIEGFGELGDL